MGQKWDKNVRISANQEDTPCQALISKLAKNYWILQLFAPKPESQKSKFIMIIKILA